MKAWLGAVTHKEVVLLQLAVEAEGAVHGLSIPLQLLHRQIDVTDSSVYLKMTQQELATLKL